MPSIMKSSPRGRASALLLVVLYLGLAPATISAQEEPPAAAVEILVDIAFGTDVDRETRTLEGEAETFAADLERIYCLTRIRNAQPPLTVTHAWFHDGKSMALVELEVGSGDWRTYSSKRILPSWTGDWEVKVLDAAGKVLASREFTVE